MEKHQDPSYRKDMTAQEVEYFRTLRDVTINARLSAAMDQLDARRAAGEVIPDSLINPLGQPSRIVDIIGSPRDGGARPHLGLDSVPANGDKHSGVYAMAAGTILYVGVYSKPAGNTVILLDDAGRIHYYMHLADGSTDQLQGGQRVSQGEMIAQMGHSGQRRNGQGYAPHLHVAMRALKDSDYFRQHQTPGLLRLAQLPDAEGDQPATPLSSGMVLKPGHHLTQYGVINPEIEGKSFTDESIRTAEGRTLVYSGPVVIAQSGSIVPALPPSVTGGESVCLAGQLPCPPSLGLSTPQAQLLPLF